MKYNIMSKNTNYFCGICKSKPDQISHHKMHLDTQKHKDKKELFELKLSKLSKDELNQKYKNIDINSISNAMETIIFENSRKLIFDTTNENDIIAMSQTTDINDYTISNKDALRDKIHEIHNYLRNNGAGYGMNALKVFNVLYGLKKIEEKGLIDKLGLKRPECEFSYLHKLATSDNKNNELQKLKYLILDNIIDSISENKLGTFLLYELPRHLSPYVFAHLIKEINKISIIEEKCNVLLSGKIYEYFIGRDQTAISELGAYFTDRHIVEYIYDKLNLQLNEDSSVPSMVDPFGGSGGFTTGFINYLNNNFDVNWKKNINNVYHFDMNEDVIKSAALEFFCLTGELPSMTNNMNCINTFKYEFNNKKFNYLITNPPYGGDKLLTSDAKNKRNKVREYIKNELKTLTDSNKIKQRQQQLLTLDKLDKEEKKEAEKSKVCVDGSSMRIRNYARKHDLKGNDKESVSLILMMDLLEKDGIACGVLKEGVFFNKTYAGIRKHLIENFNVKEVISVPSDQFENTSTKTSILIFDNTGTTKEVIFRELIVERYTEDKIVEVSGNFILEENKGDIRCITDRIISQATKDELLKNSICSLNGKDYNLKKVQVGKGYKLVKLGDITDINTGKTPSTKESKYWEDGNNLWVSVSDLNNNYIYDTKEKITDVATKNMNKIPKDSILMSFKLSMGKLGIASKDMYCNEAIVYINSKIEKISQKYLYFILNTVDLDIYARGTIGKGNLNQDLLKIVEIPIPESVSKLKEWVDKIDKPFTEKNQKQQKIKQLEASIQERIKHITENEECEEVELGSICEIKSGEYITKKNTESGIYPVYGGGEISNYINKYNRENDIIINKDGISSNCIRYEKGKFFLNHHGWTLKFNNKEYKSYLSYWLLNNQNLIYELSNGTNQKGLTQEKLLKLKIKIPKNDKLIKELEPTFTELEKLQDEVKVAETTYKELIQELGKETVEGIKETTPEIKVEICSANFHKEMPRISEVEKKKTSKKSKE